MSITDHSTGSGRIYVKFQHSSLVILNLSLIFVPVEGRSKFFGEKNQPSPSQSISITVSDVKMPSDNEQTENISKTTAATRTPDRLCPTNYHSYRRHSSPSALGESAAFEFPESSGDPPHSPEEDSPTPMRHGGTRNYSSPFLSRGNTRTRAQSSSSDFTSGEIGKSSSLLSSCHEDDIFSDMKFELQAPPKARSKRSRTCSSGAAVLARDPVINSSLLQSQSVTHSDHNSVEKTRRRIHNTVENGDVARNGDDFIQTPKATDRRRRSSPNAPRERNTDPAVGCLGITGDQSPELTQSKLSTRRPSSPCRLYKIVKDAEERVLNLKTQRRPSSPKPCSHPPPKSPVSPISSPRSPLSPSASSVSAGVVVTSSRPSRRRSSISSAASAFAAATAGASPSYAATSPTATKFRFGE